MSDDDPYSMDHADRVEGGGVAELVVGLVQLIDGARAVRRRWAGWRAAARRWPAPGTLGMLTNDEIDRLPVRPGRS